MDIDDLKNNVVGLGLMGAGATGFGTSMAARGFHKVLGSPQVDMSSLRNSIKDIGEAAAAPDAQFAQKYVESLSNIAKVPVNYTTPAGDKVRGSVSDYMLDLERRGAKLLTDESGNIEGTRIGRALKRVLPAEMFEGAKSFADHIYKNVTNPAETEAAMEHYKEFAKGEANAYRQLMKELNHVEFVHLLGDGSVAPAAHEKGLLSVWSNALTKADKDINKYVTDRIGFNGPDYTPFFKELRSNYGITSKMTPQQVQDRLLEKLFYYGSPANLAENAEREMLAYVAKRDGIMRDGENIVDVLAKDKTGELRKMLNERANGLSMADIQYKINNPISKFSRLLIKGAYGGASNYYSNLTNIVDKLNGLRSIKPLALASALTGAGLYNVYNTGIGPMLKNASADGDMIGEVLDEDVTPSGRVALELAGAVPGYLGTSNAIDIYKRRGWRKLNPFAPVKGVVFGGNINPLGKGSGSFTNQSNALVKALTQGDAIEAERIPAYNEPLNIDVVKDGKKFRVMDGDWSAREIGDMLSPKNLRDLDFVAQVGYHPGETAIERAMKNGDIARYRSLSDFKEGNFLQPDEWLGANQMKVFGDNNGYTRFIVPGGDIKQHGRKGNIVVPNIAVSDIFRKTNFNSDMSKPLGVMSIGGGSANVFPFTDIHGDDGFSFKTDEKGNVVRNIIDDFAEVFRNKHKGAGELHVHLGNSLDYDTPTGNMLGALKKQHENEAKLIAAGKLKPEEARFKGLNMVFDTLMPQKSMVNQFANATDLLLLPGSTSAELAAMGGDKLPAIVSMLPDTTKAWVPGHWEGNADYLSTILGSKKVGVNDPNRLNALTAAFATPSKRQAPPVWLDGQNIQDTIMKDVKLDRLKGLGKMLGHGAMGALGIGMAAKGAVDAMNGVGVDKKSVIDAAIDKFNRFWV